MSYTKIIEIQDNNNNIYYPKTSADNVEYNNSNIKNILDNHTELLSDLEKNYYPIIEAIGENDYIGTNIRIKKIEKGTRCTLFIENDATGECSLNLNNFGKISIKNGHGDIVDNLKSEIPYDLCYNGSDFILQNKGGGDATPEDVREGKTFTNNLGFQIGTRNNINIAKELGITLESAQILTGYKGLDKNGNIVDGIAPTLESLGDNVSIENSFSSSGTNEQIINIGKKPKILIIRLLKNYYAYDRYLILFDKDVLSWSNNVFGFLFGRKYSNSENPSMIDFYNNYCSLNDTGFILNNATLHNKKDQITYFKAWCYE